MSSPSLEVLGITVDHEVAYRFHDGRGHATEVMTLSHDDLGVLTREIQRDLPLWPTRECRYCGADAVAVVEYGNACNQHIEAAS